jgi:hypothetical protein
MRNLAAIASIAVRHAVAIGAVVLTGCVFWTVAYFSLLMWAAASEGGMGSPVLYPIGIVLILCGAVVASLLFFLPPTLVSEVLCRARGWPTLIGIPLTFVLFCFVSLFWSFIANLARPSDEISVWSLATGIIVTLAVPLGLYWWAAEFPHVLWELVGFFRSFWRKRKKNTEPYAAPNGGPATSVDNPNAPGGPPSVS